MTILHYIRIVPLLLGITFGAAGVFGAASSTNFKIDSDQIDSGSTIATSSSFKLEGTIGQFVSGTLESTSFTTASGGAAGSAGGSMGENQVSPVVSNINFSYTDNGTPLGFSEGITPSLSTTTIYVNGTVVDQNGASTMTSVASTLYRTSVGDACSANSFNCYEPTGTCTITPTTASAAHYACRYDVAAYIDSTDAVGTYSADTWTARVSVVDATSYSSYTTGDIEVNSVAALTVATSTISFASMPLGATTTASTSQSVVVTQAGNVVADVMFSSFTNLTCTQLGSIPKENLKWAIENVDYAHASSTSFTSTPVRSFMNVARKIDATTPFGTAYLNIGIPDQGLSGTCAGTVILNVISTP